MSLFGRSRRELYGISGAQDLIPQRLAARRTGSAVVTSETALRHSAVWACLRLRADLISTMPVDVYRRVGGLQIEVTKPPVLVTPGGDRVDMQEWLYSTQFDLDRGGNCFGIIEELTGRGLPARIELVSLSDVSVIVRKGKLAGYRIGGQTYAPEQVWHERQYTVAGLPVGLSPVAYAAWSIGEYLSAQQFALEWFGNGKVPAARMKNTARAIPPDKAAEAKERYRASVSTGDLFVYGADWDFQMNDFMANQTDFLDAKNYGVGDVARFFGCPGDLIDAAVSSGSITYANITQRNLQFLIMNLGPAIIRRENKLTQLTPRPQYVKLNSDALLRMDPQTRAATIQARIAARTLAPSEARALDDLPPLTEEQIAEFDRLFGAPTKSTSAAETIQKAYLGVGKMITSDEARRLANEAGADLPVPGPAFLQQPTTKVAGVTP